MLRQTTRQLVNKTTSEAVVGTTESRNYGWGEAGSQLMARSSQPFYTFYTQSKPLAFCHLPLDIKQSVFLKPHQHL